MSSPEKIALFDRYLNEEMNTTEREGFEERLRHSESFRAEFAEYQKDLAVLEKGKEYFLLKEMVDDFHTPERGKKNSVISMSAKIWITSGVAAAILLLVLFNPFQVGDTSESNAGYSYSYNDDVSVEEATEEPGMEGDADLLEHELKDSIPMITSNPYGTCFLMNHEGYFFTVNHLVNDNEKLRLQQKDLGIAFEAEVVYVDSVYDFAILKSNDFIQSFFTTYPFIPTVTPPSLGDPVFSLGYPKKDIVYSPGAISSDTGFDSDSAYIELSMPVNGGNSGGPVFADDGSLIAIITARNSEKQSVGYALKYTTVIEVLSNLSWEMEIDLTENKLFEFSSRSERVDYYRTYIFEVHE